MGAPPTNALDTAPLSIGADVYEENGQSEKERDLGVTGRTSVPLSIVNFATTAEAVVDVLCCPRRTPEAVAFSSSVRPPSLRRNASSAKIAAFIRHQQGCQNISDILKKLRAKQFTGLH